MDINFYHYTKLFWDSFVSATILPTGNYSILSAMKIYGSFSMIAVIMIATLGAWLGYLSCYILGYAIASLRGKAYDSSPVKTLMSKVPSFLHFGIVCFLPLLPETFTMILLFYGYDRFNIRKFMIITLFAQLMFCSYKFFS